MHHSFLALGDSYTIGEQVLLTQNFPYQTVQLLRKKGYKVYAPEIIATTGHTTDELNNSIETSLLLQGYDVVCLLIGVNNQYRGHSSEDFEPSFENLLLKAIRLATNNANHVFVLSIPDWGVTPFASDRNKQQIAEEIDAYNLVCNKLCKKYGTQFIDVTTIQREDGNKEEFLAADKLHPSEKEYAKWAQLLSQLIISQLQ